MSKFTDEQLAAIAATGRTIVSASAGSGKTTVMIEKMIRLILDKGVDVTRILAVTYTKKAAASMKDKLRKELVKAINKKETSPEEKARLKAQYRLVPLADISTVHSFCAKFIRTHFYATDVGNKFGIIADDDADGTALKNRAVENVFETAYEAQDEDFLKLLSVYYRKKKDDTLREIIQTTHTKVRTHVGYREELLASGKGDEATFDAVCRDAYEWFVGKTKFYREKVLALCRAFTADSSPLAPAFVKHCGALLDNLNGWLDAGDLFTLAQLPWKKMPSKPKMGSEPISPDFERWVAELFSLQEKIKKTSDKERMAVQAREVELKRFQLAAETARSLAKYVLLFDEEYTRLKRRRGVLDYNDLEHITLELLSNEDIAAEMRDKYDYVFVDEYQDVNPVQERIINGVSGENLFLVGDIKQSIYGFRGSKSVFFAQKWQEFLDNPADNALKLSKNFRSTTPVLDAVNTQFCEIMTKTNSEVDYAADGVMQFGGLYEPGKGSVQLHFVGKEKEEKEETELSVYSVRENAGLREVQLSKMAKKIREIVELERGREYFDIEDGTYKRVRYSDIAVLDRWKKGSIVEVIAALAAEGVPVSSEAPLNVCEFPEIKSLIDLLKLIDNEEQDIPLASVLLSAVGGLTENDLVRIRLAYRDVKPKVSFRVSCRKYREEKTDETARKLDEFFLYFEKIRRFASVKDAGEVLTRVIAEKQLEAHLLAGVNGESCLKRIHRFLEETRNPEPLDVHDFLGRLKMLDYTVQYCENGGENAVHVMTMHASKGLEFPVVILSNMSRSFRVGDTDEGMYVDGYGLAPKAYDTSDMTKASTVLRLLNNRRAVDETVRDELNLYYVALTRAKYSLHMIFDEESQGTDIRYGRSFEEITDFSLWEKYKTTGAGIEIPMLERQALAVEADSGLVEKIVAAIGWKYGHSGCEDMPAKTSPTAVMKLADCKEPKERIAAFDNPNTDGDYAAERPRGETSDTVGSAYHAFLERFDFSLLQPLQGDKEGLCGLVEETLAALGADESFSSEYHALLRVDKLTEILTNSVFYRLGGARLYKEQRFMAALPAAEVLGLVGAGDDGCPACDEEMLLQGAIDLLAVFDDGVEIIDYKYSQKNAAALKSTYALQLRLYKMAVSRALRLPLEKVRCTLVNIYLGYEIEID